jgi:hypothetical protein
MHKKTLLLILIFAIFFSFNSVLAESYDIYVDEDCEETQDGTSDNPYCSITEALENASSKKNKIYLNKGTYKEKLKLDEKIELHGKDKDDVVIENPSSGSTILGKGDNIIKNITVKGGYSGIVFEKEGVIEKCIIKNVRKNAIDLLPNDGEVEIKKSKITNNAKGIYVQSGRSIFISENEFIDNSEEGIDLREDISGFIQNNEISKNGESGIEVIIGNANLIISNNILSKNGASGIAAQFYPFINKIGEITIINNKISGNTNYGLDCKNTRGGTYSGDYWDKSIELAKNTIENNEKKAINPMCSIVRAINKKEEDSQLINELVEVTDKNIEEKRIAQEEAQKEEERLLFLEEINTIEVELENYINDSASLCEEIEKREKIKLIFFGYDKEKLAQLKNLNLHQEENRKKLEEFKSLTDRDLISNRAISIAEKLDKALEKNNILFSEKSTKKSFLSWLEPINDFFSFPYSPNDTLILFLLH